METDRAPARSSRVGHKTSCPPTPPYHRIWAAPPPSGPVRGRQCCSPARATDSCPAGAAIAHRHSIRSNNTARVLVVLRAPGACWPCKRQNDNERTPERGQCTGASSMVDAREEFVRRSVSPSVDQSLSRSVWLRRVVLDGRAAPRVGACWRAVCVAFRARGRSVIFCGG